MAQFYQEALKRPDKFNFATDVVDYWASTQPEIPAMHWLSQDQSEYRVLTFGHFQRQSHRIAALFNGLGIRAPQRIIMILPRIPAWWEIAVAAIRSGIVICPATTLLVEKDIEFRCLQTRATVFIGDSTSVNKFLKVQKNCPEIKHIIQADTQVSSSPAIDFFSALSKIPKDAVYENSNITPNDPSLIYFTSGTSGPPKMVQHNQISYPLAHMLTGKHWLRLSPGKVYWNLSEQGWAKAAWSFFGSWNCGASLFIHDDRGAFNAIRLLSILHKYPITTLCAPPTVYRQLVLQESRQYLKANRPRCLSQCNGAGEPLNASVITEWEKMTDLKIFDGYGQTETILTCGNFADSPVRPGSMGKPTPGVPLHVIGPDGADCQENVEGDIAILVGANDGSHFFGLFDGYLNREGTLDQRIKKLGKSSWYLTGDRATRDKQGYFWFVGRADDVINSAGYRIGPFEVESTLKLHPGVIESAVVSSPDEMRGEVVKAFVVVTDDYKSSKTTEMIIKELQDFCKQNAGPYKYPRKIQIVDATFLPKTISGKIKRNELKALEWKKDEKSKL